MEKVITDERFRELLKQGRLDIVDRVTGEVVARIEPRKANIEAR